MNLDPEARRIMNTHDHFKRIQNPGELLSCNDQLTPDKLAMPIPGVESDHEDRGIRREIHVRDRSRIIAKTRTRTKSTEIKNLGSRRRRGR